MPMSDLQKQELPAHLSPGSNEELKDQLKKVAEATEDKAGELDPRSEKEYTFTLSHKDAAGKVWSGQFTTKILNIHERTQAGIMRSMMIAGRPIESLDAMTVEIALMVSHLTYSLTENPTWADNLRELDDPGVIQAIYTEVDSHESFFLGWGAFAGKSRKKSG